jgi:hypothetical protein
MTNADTALYKVSENLKSFWVEIFTTALISILVHNLQTEFKEGFYKRMGKVEAMPRQLKYTKS